VITGFVVGFLVLASNSTAAEPGAVPAATAAYVLPLSIVSTYLLTMDRYAAALEVILQFGSRP
jgi:hypothetical protein